MSDTLYPMAIAAEEVPVPAIKSVYPTAFATRVEGRTKRKLGDVFGLMNFGVNLTTLAPGAMSALRHSHSIQDEFIYVLSGEATLITDAGETVLTAGMCAGFRAGTGDAHHLINRSDDECRYIEVGDRLPGDKVAYPDDDLAATMGPEGWIFTHKDGTKY